MKIRAMLLTNLSLIAALAMPVQLGAQNARYKLIDLGTFGGPDSFVNGDPPSMINNRGAVAGAADTLTPCSYPGGFISRGLISPAFMWRDGVLTNVGLLPGGCFTLPNAINSNGMMAGSGDIGIMDETTGFRSSMLISGTSGKYLIWAHSGETVAWPMT
jgi:uncharacterized membrane protein